jgi:cytochrome c554/c'-like protein
MVAIGLATGAYACGGGGGASLTHAELTEPETCKRCHPEHYEEWSRSMHAYASDDPVFIAMNKRGQREQNIGDFCVKCHAPLAFQLGLTKDGTNLESLPKAMRGVTCYFCHSIDATTDTHNAGVHLATDDVMRGNFGDAVAGTPHKSAVSALHDGNNLESAKLCGSCHDIVTPAGAAIERTFAEWQKTLFAKDMLGQSCASCHMNGRAGNAAEVPVELQSEIRVKQRRVHLHSFAAVDVALTDAPGKDTLEQEIRDQLDTKTIQGVLCVEQEPNPRLVYQIDNIGPGHSFPSGAAQDRRVWVEIVASTKEGRVLYRSGAVANGAVVEETPDDPELWLIRDCMFDATGMPVDMFWQAASVRSNQIPGPVALPPDPRSQLTHVPYVFAATSSAGASGLSRMPDRVVAQVHLQPIGIGVLDDLVKSGDLDPAFKAKMPTFDMAATKLVWTATSAVDAISLTGGVRLKCVGLPNPTLRYAIDIDPQTISQKKCAKP